MNRSGAKVWFKPAVSYKLNRACLAVRFTISEAICYKLTPLATTCPSCPPHIELNQYFFFENFQIFKQKCRLCYSWSHGRPGRHPLWTTCLTWKYVLTVKVLHIIRFVWKFLVSYAIFWILTLIKLFILTIIQYKTQSIIIFCTYKSF